MKNNDQRSSILWFGIGLAIALYSKKYGLGTFSSPGPGFVPFLSGLAIALLALVVFFQQRYKEGKESLKDIWVQRKWPTMLMVMAVLVLYTIFLKTLGFILTTFLLIAFLYRTMEPLSWRKVLFGAVITALGSYAIFQLWLQAQLPEGIFGF